MNTNNAAILKDKNFNEVSYCKNYFYLCITSYIISFKIKKYGFF